MIAIAIVWPPCQGAGYLDVVQRRCGGHAPRDNDELVPLRPCRAPLRVLHRALLGGGDRTVELPVRMHEEQPRGAVVRLPRGVHVGAGEAQHRAPIGAPLERRLL